LFESVGSSETSKDSPPILVKLLNKSNEWNSLTCDIEVCNYRCHLTIADAFRLFTPARGVHLPHKLQQ
jgi:hypothetical protein